MAETIQTITDPARFEGMFGQYFAGKEVFLRTKSGDLTIHYLGYHDGNVAFRIPRVKKVPDIIMVFVRDMPNTIYTNLKVLENKEDTFIFLPLKFQIISEARREDRISTGTPGDKKIIYISNIISESMLRGFIDSNEKKMGQIKETVARNLKGAFERLRIVFINESSIDVRKKHFLEVWTPIFIKDLNAAPTEKEINDFRYYRAEIYAKDYKLAGHREFISEVSLPLIYKNIIPYGYIQVNNTKPMNDGHVTAVKKVAMLVNEYFIKEKIFVPAEDKFLVSDISKNGLGIVFKNRRQLRFFVADSRIIIDMILPNLSRVNMGVIPKNTSFHDNGIIKVGLEIGTIDAISEANFDEFLEGIKQ